MDCGWLGEGPGPFITALRSDLPQPSLPTARFTSRHPYSEAQITQDLLRAPSFDAALAALSQAGFQLEAVSFDVAFGPGAARA